MSNFVTLHDSNGKAIFSTQHPTSAHPIPIYIGQLTNLWSTTSVPPNLSSTTDVDQFFSTRTSLPPKGHVCPPGGTSVLIMEIQPNAPGLMHRTMTLDFIYVLDGEVELSLDSGEKRMLKKGDSLVQRATMHSWANNRDEMAKLLIFIQACEEPVKVGEKELGAEWP